MTPSPDPPCNGVPSSCDGAMADPPPAAPLTAEEIAAITERATKATPAPWKREAEYFVAEVPQGRPGGEVIGSAHPSSSYLSGYPRTQQVANAEFIIHARTDIPALIVSHAALRDRLARQEAIEMAARELVRWCDEDADNIGDDPECFTLLRAALATPTDGAARAGDAAEGESK